VFDSDLEIEQPYRIFQDIERMYQEDFEIHRKYLNYLNNVMVNNQGLVMKYAQKIQYVVAKNKMYKSCLIDFQDLVQAGNIGMVRAAQLYDHRRGYLFSTYAYYWIS
jgi:RNA polymerase primary sigma factor